MRKFKDTSALPRRIPWPWAVVTCLALGTGMWNGRAFPAGPASTPLEDVVRRLESSYRGVKTLRANFTQTYTWGEQKRSESGTVSFARGGLMRWDYEQPASKLFYSDGRNLYLYVPEEKRLTRSPLKSSADSRAPFALILSRLDLRKFFSKIEFADQELKPAPGGVALRGFPKKGHEADYQEVLMELNPAFDIRRLVVAYPDRSVMEFTFERIERDVAFRPDLFRFTPPPGTNIDEQP